MSISYRDKRKNEKKKTAPDHINISDTIKYLNTDIVVNLLPVAHPQLNPIEMLWNWIKTYVKTNNHEFSMPAIKRLTDERIEQLGQEYWTKACDKSHAFAIASFEADAMLLGDDEDVEDVESNDDFLILDNNNDV